MFNLARHFPSVNSVIQMLSGDMSELMAIGLAGSKMVWSG